MALARHFLLNTGTHIPTIALGTYLALGQEVQQAVDHALHTGYRHIDTARSYGNEADIGETLNSTFSSGKLKRGDVFITTKVPAVYMAPADVERSIEESLEALRLKYVDLLLVHHPWGLKNTGNFRGLNEKGKRVFCHRNLVETWHAMEKVMRSGRTRAIGLSNFNQPQMERIIQKCSIKPANLQLECHAYLQQHELRAYCQKEGIIMTAYSPFGSPSYDRAPENAPILLDDPLLKEMSNRMKRPVSQLLLRFLLQLGTIPLPKSVNQKRIADNFNIYNFHLEASDMKLIGTLDRGFRYFTFPEYRSHPEFPGTGGEPF